MIDRYDTAACCLMENGKFVLHTDHLSRISEMEEENAKLRAEVAAFREGMPDKPHIFTMIDNIEIGCIEHGESEFTMCEECIAFNNWLKNIAAKVGT